MVFKSSWPNGASLSRQCQKGSFSSGHFRCPSGASRRTISHCLGSGRYIGNNSGLKRTKRSLSSDLLVRLSSCRGRRHRVYGRGHTSSRAAHSPHKPQHPKPYPKYERKARSTAAVATHASGRKNLISSDRRPFDLMWRHVPAPPKPHRRVDAVKY